VTRFGGAFTCRTHFMVQLDDEILLVSFGGGPTISAPLGAREIRLLQGRDARGGK